MQEDQIKKPDTIAAHLGRLQRGHHLAKINIDGSSNSFNSMLVSVDAIKHTMLLDVLYPDAAHQQILQKKKFTFQVSHEGVKISFKGTIKKLVEDDGKPAYFINFPDTLIYHQRRQSFRAPISKDTLLPITLNDPESDKTCEGIIINISRGGLGLQFNHGLEYSFKKFNLAYSQFCTTENIEINCDIEIRNITNHPEKKYIIVGVQFMNLDKEQKKKIQNFALKMERKMIQRKRT